MQIFNLVSNTLLVASLPNRPLFRCLGDWAYGDGLRVALAIHQEHRTISFLRPQVHLLYIIKLHKL